MKKLKVALVHDFLQSFGGAERVTLALSKIFPEAPIYTLTYNPKLAKFFRGRKIIVSKLQKYSLLPAKFLLPFYAGAIEGFDFSGFDVVISSSNSFAKNVITPAATTHISYVHSPMRYVWDAWHTYLGEQSLSRAITKTMRGLLFKIRMWDKLGSSRVDMFVANSRNVRNRIRKYYRRDAQIIYPPVDVDKISMHPENKGYFLAISRLSYYKRLDLAIEACRDLDVPLIVIGTGEEESKLKRLAGPNTKILGWVNDAEKIKYLQNCRALIFPGEEDFGIVPVEAMAAGKPVIAFRKGGLLETVIEGKTGIFFDEQSVVSLKRTLRLFITQENKFDCKIIRKHAKKFSKKRFQDEIRELVAESVKKKVLK
ncbi:glycosyltransferase family 4 protein [candidate division Kazan bacterium]|uniref:Glycosyltransferase family 4 protein n=1 Tax=candidate division Kazan bacterium TaxID=2202143 RepID=A0A420ZDL9_UNCK3|nr:MAG: glycosyltransferase family 4 protein [candidate division Kazan bacterium]